MSGDKDATFTLKAVINKQKNKVLFAEIENDLANVLLGFMTLPLGRIVQLMRNHYGENTHVIGCLNTLYNGVANLDSSHFKSKDKKQMLLDPGSAYSSPFQNMNLSFYCSAPTGPLGKSVTGNFVKNSASFIVSDDLRMHNVKRSSQNVSTMLAGRFGWSRNKDGGSRFRTLDAVGNLFGYRSALNNIVNLSRSMLDMDRELFNDLDTRDWLLGYDNPGGAQSLLTTLEEVHKSIYVDSRSREFIVTDDLTVTPFSMCSTLSLLNQMKISASDVEVLELHIGLKLKEYIVDFCVIENKGIIVLLD
ncbi:hypothetical protein ACS0TY_030967 [Phlomoides rotata]